MLETGRKRHSLSILVLCSVGMTPTNKAKINFKSTSLYKSACTMSWWLHILCKAFLMQQIELSKHVFARFKRMSFSAFRFQLQRCYKILLQFLKKSYLNSWPPPVLLKNKVNYTRYPLLDIKWCFYRKTTLSYGNA
jgi:hypothetical protein